MARSSHPHYAYVLLHVMLKKCGLAWKALVARSLHPHYAYVPLHIMLKKCGLAWKALVARSLHSHYNYVPLDVQKTIVGWLSEMELDNQKFLGLFSIIYCPGSQKIKYPVLIFDRGSKTFEELILTYDCKLHIFKKLVKCPFIKVMVLCWFFCENCWFF